MINFLVKRFYHMIQNVGSISSNSIRLIRFVFLENAKFFFERESGNKKWEEMKRNELVVKSGNKKWIIKSHATSLQNK